MGAVQPLYTPLCLEEGMKLQDIIALAMCNFEAAGKYKDLARLHSVIYYVQVWASRVTCDYLSSSQA